MRRRAVLGIATAALLVVPAGAAVPAPFKAPLVLSTAACSEELRMAGAGTRYAIGFVRKAGGAAREPLCRRAVIVDAGAAMRTILLPGGAEGQLRARNRPPVLAFGRDGTLLASWRRGPLGATETVAATLAPGASSFTAPTVLPAGEGAEPLFAAIDGAGAAYVASSSGRILERSPAGAWQVGVDLQAEPVAFDIARSGAGVVMFTIADGEVAVAAVRAPAGTWSEARFVGSDLPGGVEPVAVIGDEDVVTMAWARGAGETSSMTLLAGETPFEEAVRVPTPLDIGGGGGIGVSESAPPLLSLDVGADGHVIFAGVIGRRVIAARRGAGLAGAWDAKAATVASADDPESPLALATTSGDVVAFADLRSDARYIKASASQAAAGGWAPVSWLSGRARSPLDEGIGFPVAAAVADRALVAWVRNGATIERGSLRGSDARGTKSPLAAISNVRVRFSRGAAPCGSANGVRYCAAGPLDIRVLFNATGRGRLAVSFERAGRRATGAYAPTSKAGANNVPIRVHEFFPGSTRFAPGTWKPGSRWRVRVAVEGVRGSFAKTVSLDGVKAGRALTVRLAPAA